MFTKAVAKFGVKTVTVVVGAACFGLGAGSAMLWNKFVTQKKPKGLRDEELERLVEEAVNLKPEADKDKPAEEKKADEEKKEA